MQEVDLHRGINRRIGNDEAVGQAILFLKSAQVSEFLTMRGPLAIDVAGIVCETEYYQSLVFVGFIPALQSGKGEAARATPGRPEVEQYNLAAQVG